VAISSISEGSMRCTLASVADGGEKEMLMDGSSSGQ
jgi:hypothetical protein